MSNPITGLAQLGGMIGSIPGNAYDWAGDQYNRWSGKKAAEIQQAAQEQFASDAQQMSKEALSQYGFQAGNARRTLAETAAQAQGTLGAGAEQAGGALRAGAEDQIAAQGRGFGAAESRLADVAALQGYGDQAAQAIQQSDISSLGGLLDQPGGLYGGFEESPGYQFRQEQGEQAINRAMAAKGGRSSGAAMKALQAHGQGLASQEFANFAARRQAEMGQRAQVGGQLAGMQAGQGSALANLGMQQAGMNLQAEAMKNQMAMAAAGNAGASDMALANFAGQMGSGLLYGYLSGAFDKKGGAQPTAEQAATMRSAGTV